MVYSIPTPDHPMDRPSYPSDLAVKQSVVPNLQLSANLRLLSSKSAPLNLIDDPPSHYLPEMPAYIS